MFRSALARVKADADAREERSPPSLIRRGQRS
jgi:hypothetical protein